MTPKAQNDRDPGSITGGVGYFPSSLPQAKISTLAVDVVRNVPSYLHMRGRVLRFESTTFKYLRTVFNVIRIRFNGRSWVIRSEGPARYPSLDGQP